MPAFKRFEVVFPNNYTSSFQPGQLLSGQLIVEPSREVKIKRIVIALRGFSKVYWSETMGYTDSETNEERSRTIHHGSECQYLNEDLLLYGNAHGSSDLTPTLKAGFHVFDFSYVLSLDCATSFQGKYGEVLYNSKVTMERPWRPAKTIAKSFYVVAPLDLNDPILGLKKERVYSRYASKELGFFKKGQVVQITGSIPRGGFAAGEKLPVRIEIENSSGKNVKKVRLDLVQEATFHADTTGQTNLGHTTIDHWSSSEDRKGDFTRDIELNLPCNTPPTDIACRIIKLIYYLKLTVKTSGFVDSKTIKTTIPITIGTIPLHGSLESSDKPNSSDLKGAELEFPVASLDKKQQGTNVKFSKLEKPSQHPDAGAFGSSIRGPVHIADLDH